MKNHKFWKLTYIDFFFFVIWYKSLVKIYIGNNDTLKNLQNYSKFNILIFAYYLKRKKKNYKINFKFKE